MKCTKCGEVAVIGMPQHRLKLCAEHMRAWVPQMAARAIEKHAMFPADARLLVAASGGKDSLSLWHILAQLGYRTEGLYIHLGIGDASYSDVSEQKARAFAEAHGLNLRVVYVAAEYGRTIPELARTRRGQRTCSVCGLIKRHVMNRVAAEGGYNALVTGHNLDDEAAVLFMNTLHWQANYLRRQAPVLPSPHPRLVRKAKPLCHLYEREIAAYALLQGISFVEDECPYSLRAKTLYYKELLTQLEHRSPGSKQQFYQGFLRAREVGLIQAEEEAAPLETCTRCGQPTHAGGLCAFCRLWETQR